MRGIPNGEEHNGVDAVVKLQDLPHSLLVESCDPAASKAKIDGPQDHVLDRDGRIQRKICFYGAIIYPVECTGSLIGHIHINIDTLKNPCFA